MYWIVIYLVELQIPYICSQLRLVRVVANLQCLTLFRDARVKSLSIVESSHSPILLSINCWNRTGKLPRFRFKAKWSLHDSILQLSSKLGEHLLMIMHYQLARKIDLLKKETKIDKKSCYNKEFHALTRINENSLLNSTIL